MKVVGIKYVLQEPVEWGSADKDWDTAPELNDDVPIVPFSELRYSKSLNQYFLTIHEHISTRLVRYYELLCEVRVLCRDYRESLHWRLLICSTDAFGETGEDASTRRLEIISKLLESLLR